MSTYTPPRTRDWWEHWNNLYILVRYLEEEEGYDQKQLVKVMESPWSYEREFMSATDIYS